MSKLSENIKTYRKLNNLTQVDLAKLLGIAPTAVSAWEVGRNQPLMDNVERMASIFNVKKSELLGESNSHDIADSDILSVYDQLTPPRQLNVLNYAENQLDEQNGIVKLSGYIKEDIPEYTTSGLYGALSAGTGQQIFDNPIEEVEIPTSIIPSEPYDIMLKIVGDSMQPAFKDGEYVFIKLTKDIRSGQFAAIIVDGEAYLKKVYIDDDCLRLVSLNKGYEDIIVDDISNVEIVGTVVL